MRKISIFVLSMLPLMTLGACSITSSSKSSNESLFSYKASSRKAESIKTKKEAHDKAEAAKKKKHKKKKKKKESSSSSEQSSSVSSSVSESTDSSSVSSSDGYTRHIIKSTKYKSR